MSARINPLKSSAGVIAAILFLITVVGSVSGWAQTCPTSPIYTPDFSSNGACLTLNGSATLVSGASTVLQMNTSTYDQVGSAWYTSPQVVENGFTTTFQFQFTNPSIPPADGIAFVIQNSSATAIGDTSGSGGALGYGDSDSNSNPSQGDGIPHSLAIEFDTYQDAWDPAAVNGSVSHVAIQSCGTGANTSHHNYLCGGTTGANSTLGAPVVTVNLADGAVHNIVVNYVPTCSTCIPATTANLQVIVDGLDLYPNGIAVDLSTIGLGAGGTAYVGFTASTGGGFETQALQSWVFSPLEQGQPINLNNPTSLTQTFVFNSTPGEASNFGFDYSVPSANGGLTIQPGTTPVINAAGITQFDWATIVNGTSMADATCLIAAGQSTCTVYTLLCTTTANPIPSGANCPQSNARNILFNQEVDLALNQTGIVNGILTVPPGYAPGLAEAPDALITGSECNFPTGDPLAAALCPQSIMTQLEDNTPRGGGTGTTTNSTYVFFCCEPEWQTTPAIALWNNSTSVPAAFTSVPPLTPIPNTNNFHAAQGASVVVGAEPHGTLLDTTYPLPAEQSLSNTVPCPALGGSPTPWSTQNPQTFSVSGIIANYDNNGNVTPLAEGAYDAHYFSVDCDAFEELIFPSSLNISPGTPGPNVATFKTVPFNIDLTKPTVTSITLNPAGGSYTQNSLVTATITCFDPSSATVANFYSGVASCGAQSSPQSFVGNQQSVTTTPITLSTSGLGTQTFTASATDVAGNVSVPSSFTYTIAASTVQVVVGTNLAGLSFTVDSVTYTSTQTFNWSTGSMHTIATTSPQTPTSGVQDTWASWSDGGAISHTVTAPGGATSYTATFNTAYQLTTAANPTGAGTVLPASGTYYAANTVVPVTATANSGYVFSSWTGSVASSNSASTSVTMTGPQTVTANFVGTQLSITPSSLNFGTVYLNSRYRKLVTLTNLGTSSITLNSTTIAPITADAAAYTYTTSCTTVLKAGKSCGVTIAFLADNVGTLTANLVFTDAAAGSPQTVSMTANVIGPVAQFGPNPVTFGTRTVGSSTTMPVVLTNVGQTNLTVGPITFSGTNPGDFSQTNSCPTSLTPGTGCSISVTFIPAAKGSITAELNVSDNGHTGRSQVELQGGGK